MTKTALITGNSSGIGRVTAELFARRGWQVAATARRPAALALSRILPDALGRSLLGAGMTRRPKDSGGVQPPRGGTT